MTLRADRPPGDGRRPSRLRPAALAFVLATAAAPVMAQTGAPSPERTDGSEAALLRSDLEARVEALERRLGASALLELVARIDTLTRENRAFRDQLEVQARALQALEQRQQDIYAELDRLAQRLASPAAAEGTATPSGEAADPEEATESAGPTPEPPAVPVASDEPAESGESDDDASGPAVQPPVAEPAGGDAPTYDPVEEQSQYERAFDLLGEGKFEEAASAFAAFLVAFPDSRYQDNARFWKGECLYALRQFEPALVEFRELIGKHPDSSRVPGAKLKIGFILQELGRDEEAARVLQELIATAPGSSEAELARDRLTGR